MAWALSGTFPHGTVEEERARSLELARGILGAFRDEVAAMIPGTVTADA